MATPSLTTSLLTASPLTASPLACARAAGALYLVIILCGVIGEGVLRSSLVVGGDAAATAANIAAAPHLFRLAFALDGLMALSDVALAILLYALLRPVEPTLALMAAAFRLVQTAILGMNLLNHHMALRVLEGAAGAGGLDKGQTDAVALVFLDAHANGYDLGLLFFGVNSLLTGWLVYRSGFLPRALGAGLAAAGGVYLAGSALRFLAPGAVEAFAPAYVIPLAAETAFCLWLLIKGVDALAWDRRRA